jgi:two-component system, NarL family, sensor histidine kinase YdfH
MKRLQAFVGKASGTERPFFFLLTLILAGITIFSILQSPDLHNTAMWILLSALMTLHIGLYWLALLLEANRKWIPAYIIIQGLLAFTITLIAGNLAMIFCLYAALIGITIGLVSSRMGRIATVGYLICLSLISYGFVMQWQLLHWWLIAMLPTTIFVVIYVSMYGRQVRTRERAEALLHELDKANLQLSEYAAQVEDLTLKNERQRMARELHDTLSQGLAGVILQLEAVDAHVRDNHIERALQVLDQTRQSARNTLEEARQAIDNLRRISGYSGLMDRLKVEIDTFSRSTCIQCEIRADEGLVIPVELGEIVLSVVAEGLSNIARHAKAAHATVEVACDANWLQMKIIDDGCGFDPEKVPPGHYGLLGIKERARLSGGDVKIFSISGKGTRMEVRIPLIREYVTA